jgi:YegS/Rv2252/BmrU family lipid kinase
MKQLLLIVNPTAGTKKASKNLAEIISVFNRAEYDVHAYMTECRGNAKRIAMEMGEKMDIIVCCGGDGTFNETVAGILEKGLNVDVGYIPAGSTNDFASSLKLPSNLIEAAKNIVNGKVCPIDAGSFSGRFFTYVASFGIFTKASYSTPQNVKNALGHLAYILEGIQELSLTKKEHVVMELDGERIEGDYLFGAICNSTSLGGIFSLDESVVDMADGKFEILLVRMPKDIAELHEVIVALNNKTYDCRAITFRSAENVKITTDPEMAWSLDGERAEGKKHIEIKNINKCIRLVHCQENQVDKV